MHGMKQRFLGHAPKTRRRRTDGGQMRWRHGCVMNGSRNARIKRNSESKLQSFQIYRAWIGPGPPGVIRRRGGRSGRLQDSRTCARMHARLHARTPHACTHAHTSRPRPVKRKCPEVTMWRDWCLLRPGPTTSSKCSQTRTKKQQNICTYVRGYAFPEQ